MGKLEREVARGSWVVKESLRVTGWAVRGMRVG
jgi:hypothetical protein